MKIVAPPYNWSQVSSRPQTRKISISGCKDGWMPVCTSIGDEWNGRLANIRRISQTNSGLIAVASAIGFILAIPLTPSSDILAARLTKRNNFIREAEMRLGALLIPMIIAPLGLVIYGITAQYDLHWIGYFFGVAMDQWGGYFYFTFTMAYAIDSYSASLPELLIATNLGKSAISFGMGYGVLDWILESGYATVISGIYMAVMLINNMVVIVFMIWGKQIRRFMAKSWVGKLHQRSAAGHK